MRRIYPPALQPSDTIMAIAPSSTVDKKLLKAGEAKCLKSHFSLRYKKEILAKDHFFAGQDQWRAKYFLQACLDPSIKALWCARGGYGATRLLPLLDKMNLPTLMRQQPKLILGYSDATALFAYFFQSTALPCVHVPLMATTGWLKMKKKSIQELWRILKGKMELGRHSYTTQWETRFLGAKRRAEGILVGGNLRVLCTLVGTPWQPKFQGNIVFLEDRGEAPYSIDRMLVQMEQAGCFRGIQGLVLGDFDQDIPSYLRKPITWGDVFLHHFGDKKIPILYKAPVGHGRRNEPLPLGMGARITKSGKIELLEQVVKS